MVWRRGSRIALTLSLGLGLAVGAFVLADPFPLRALRDLVFDGYQRAAPRAYDPALPVRVVALDEVSLSKIGQWPWSRRIVADLVTRLREAGAAVIAFDVLFSEPERGAEGTDGGLSAPDAMLRDAMAGGPVVLGQALVDMGGAPAVKPGFATAGDDPLLFVPRLGGSLTPLPALTEAAAGVGALNWIPDRDLIVRRVPTLFGVQGKLVPNYSVEALRVALGAGSLVVKSSNASGEKAAFERQTGVVAVRIGQVTASTDAGGAVRIRYAGTQDARRISAASVLDGTFDKAAVDGAIVLVGATAVALSDIRATPLEPAVPGIDIHAEMLEHLISGSTLARPDYGPGLEAALAVAAALLVGLAMAFLSPLLAATFGIAVVAGAFGGSFAAFTRAELLVDPIGPAVAAMGAFAIGATGALRRSRREQREIRDAFGRYVSPAVVEALAADPSKLALGGEIRDITVLFSDIRGFTSRSETLSAEQVVAFLNSVHTPLTEEVLKSGGTLDKFIGDGMMAFWNAPLDTPDHVRRAVDCALAMQAVMLRLEDEARALAQAEARIHVPVAIGLGIHTGTACVGNLGSAKRFDYSAVGDTVNTAARIEQTSKTYGVPMILSAEVAAAVPDYAVFPFDTITLRGRSRGTRLFALHGGPDLADAAFTSFRQGMADLMSAFEEGRGGLEDEVMRLAEHPVARAYPKLFLLYRERIAARAASLAAE